MRTCGLIYVGEARIDTELTLKGSNEIWVDSDRSCGHRVRQISVRRERVAEVRQWLANYQELKEAIEAICELNHDLLRPQRAASKPPSKQHD
jgi:hypothetical protein